MYRIALPVLFGFALPVSSQAIPTASRAADVQVGIGYSAARPDYVHRTFAGYAGYADLDLRPHIGAEVEFHSIFDTAGSQLAERSYELGLRYRTTYRRLVPYAKGMFGLGRLKYPGGLATLDYPLLAPGIGADFAVSAHIHLRGEYEYQHWTGFNKGGLHPQIVTFAVAYRLPTRPGSR